MSSPDRSETPSTSSGRGGRGKKNNKNEDKSNQKNGVNKSSPMKAASPSLKRFVYNLFDLF